jgi:ubiquinone/menaquinone biosynthesis C-methylase UbiE
MNVFINKEIAENYDAYYQTDTGNKIDLLEKDLIQGLLPKPIPNSNNMLELGCGTGHWTRLFLERGYEVTGIDVSEAMLDIAKSKNLNATFLSGDSTALDFSDNTFYIVSSITMLEFIENQQKVIDEIYRVLKPGGTVILGCLNQNSVLGRNKTNDPVFEKALFLTEDILQTYLSKFSSIQIKEAVFMNDNFEITEQGKNTQAIFLGVSAVKEAK